MSTESSSVLTGASVRRRGLLAWVVVIDRESFGQSYAQTLHQWRTRFLQSRKEIEEFGFDLRVTRMWDYYLAYCEIGFQRRTIDVNIFRFVRRGT